MAQVHYIVTDNRDEEVVTVNLSANKGKINKIAKDFVPTEDEWGDRNRISAGPSSKSYKDGFMLIFDSGDFYCEAGTEEDFRDQAEDLEYCAFFTKVKDVEILIPIGEDGYGDDELDFADADYIGGEPELAMVNGYFEIGESVETVFRHIPTFESFIGGLQKLNEYITLDYSWEEAREGEPTRDDEKKWAPVLKAFKVRKMEDLTWLAEYLPDSDNFDNNSKLVKSFQLKSIRDDQDEWQDPHGNVDFDILEYKGLLIGDHSDEMRYQGALVRTKDVKAWEAIYKEEDSEGYLY